MSESLTIEERDLRVVGAVLTLGALATGLVLRFLVGAEFWFVLLVMCASLPALVLLLYVGYLLRAGPQKQGFLLPLKVLGLSSVCMGLLMGLDLLLPTRPMAMVVSAKATAGQECVLHVGEDQLALDATPFDRVLEGDVVNVSTTRVFRRIEALSTLGGAGLAKPVGYMRPLWDKVARAVAAGVFFLLPLGLIHFCPSPQNQSWNMSMYFLVVVPSYIVSLVAVGLWIRLLLLNTSRLIG